MVLLEYLFPDGKIQKKSNTTQKRPLGKDTRDTIKAARMALAEGKVASDEQQRKHAMDLRTLYVRFKKSHPEGTKKTHHAFSHFLIFEGIKMYSTVLNNRLVVLIVLQGIIRARAACHK